MKENEKTTTSRKGLIIAVVILSILLLITIIFIIFLGVRAYKYNKKFYTVHYDKIKISDAYPHMKTGDIIMYISGIHDFSNSLLTQCIASHIGMVIDLSPDGVSGAKTGQLYLTESSARQPFYDRVYSMTYGGNMLHLLPRIKHYTGLILFCPLNYPLSDELRKKVINCAMRALGNPYPDFSSGLLQLMGVETQHRHCFQHIAHLLRCAGIVRYSDMPKDFVKSCQIISQNIQDLKLTERNFYHTPRQLLYDIGT